MPIQSITGKPGNFKTAFLVKRIMDEAKKAERPLWAAGIDGLRPGLCSTFTDPREWNAVKPGESCTCSQFENDSECTAHVIPNGSLIFIDEAWKWFGHLQDAGRQSTPKHVLQLAEHRHRGLDFVWTYQQPQQIYPFARGLMAEHRHLVRKFGTMFVDAYDWQELCEEVKNPARRADALKSTHAAPKEAFPQYKSAEVHTIKARIPARVFLLPIIVLAAVGALLFAVNWLRPSKAAEHVTGVAVTENASDDGGQGPAKPKPLYTSAAEYQRAFSPRIAAMPWTAPAFDGRAVVAQPEVFCVKSGAGLDAQGEQQSSSCTCSTEQGTEYVMDRLSCETVASKGQAYNPFKAAQRDVERTERPDRSNRSVGVQGRPPAARGGSRGGGAGFGDVAAYGALGVGAD